jgi:hypothetical protein
MGKRTNPCFCGFTMQETGEEIVNATRIRFIVLPRVRGTSDHPLVEAEVHLTLIRFFIVTNNV